MKKFFAFLLTFAMLFSLAMPAMAAEGDSLSTIYIDVGQLEEAASVQSVWIRTDPGAIVNNEPMTHVSGTIYSYDISAAVAAGDTSAEFATFSDDGATKLGDYYTTNFETGKNLWTATGERSGTWSTYGATINGNTTGDVSASYTPTAAITGVSITVDGNTYTNGDVTITPTSTIAITVTGTNFANLSVDNVLWVSSGVGSYINDGRWTVDTEANTATRDYSSDISWFENCNNFEIKYANDGGTNYIGTGIYLTYDDGTGGEEDTSPAEITGVSIMVGETVYTSGTVTLTPESGDVTIIVSGTNLQNRTNDNKVKYNRSSSMPMGSGYTWSVNETGTEASRTVPLSSFVSQTTAHEIGYCNDGSTNYIGSGVYVIYDNGSAEEDKAVITGMSITIDGVEYTNQNTSETNPAVITPNSTVQVKVYGTNLNNATSDNFASYCPKAGSDLTSSWWTIADDGTSATLSTVLTSPSDYASATEAYELSYGNSGNNVTTLVGSGVWIIYREPTYNVIIDENIANGTVTADLDFAVEGSTVTLTVTPNTGYQIGTVTVKDADGETVDFTETGVASGTYTFTMPASAVTVTATFTAIPITSAEITWGNMSFTYYDTVDEATGTEKGWTPADDAGAGTVTVKNTGNTTFTAQASYASTTDEYGTFTGSFDPASYELTAESSYTFTLKLTGKPTKAIPAGTKIGEVTITINEAAEG